MVLFFSAAFTVVASAEQNPPATTTTPSRAAQPQRPPAPQPAMDAERARRLYVSKDPKDHGLGVDFQRQIEAKKATDKRYEEVTKGVVDFSKVAETKITKNKTNLSL